LHYNANNNNYLWHFFLAYLTFSFAIYCIYLHYNGFFGRGSSFHQKFHPIFRFKLIFHHILHQKPERILIFIYIPSIFYDVS